MAEKDLGEKLLEDYADVFADIVNVLAFHGERLLLPSNLIDGSTASRYKDGDRRIREHIRDVVKYDRRHTTLAVLGIENQSKVDKHMVFRVMGYDYTSYKKQIDAKETAIHPVLTLVLHFGLKPWNGPKDVLSAIDQNLPYAKYLAENVLNPQIKVVDVAFLPEETRNQFTSDFRIVANYFCAVRENNLNQIRFNEQHIKHVAEMLDFFTIFSKDKRVAECKPVILKEAEKGAVSMCKVMDYAEKTGIEKGQYQQLYELIQSGIISLEKAAESKHLSKEDFLEKLKQLKIN